MMTEYIYKIYPKDGGIWNLKIQPIDSYQNAIDWLYNLKLRGRDINAEDVDIAISSINKFVQRIYPGPYTVRLAYDVAKQQTYFETVFKNEQDYVMWLLKTS